MKLWIGPRQNDSARVTIYYVSPVEFLEDPDGFFPHWEPVDGLASELNWEKVRRWLLLKDDDYPNNSELLEYDLSGKGKIVERWEWRY